MNIGDSQVEIGLSEFVDSRGNRVPIVLTDPPRIQLNGYQNQIFRVNADVSSILDPDTNLPLNSRVFQNYALRIAAYREDLGGGAFQSSSDIRGIPPSYPTAIRVFPGRYTTQPVFLNDAMFAIDTAGSELFVQFNDAQFRTDNGLDLAPRLPTFVSDYLMFDLSALPESARPILQDGTAASRGYFSGDLYAVSQGGDRGLFNAIDRNNFDPSDPIANLVEGRFAPPGNLGVTPPSGLGSTPGTYSLVQANPSDPFLISKITSLQGIWRDYTRMLNNQQEVMMIALPSQRDDDVQDVVLFRQTLTKDSSGRTVTASIQSFYYGFLDYSAATVKLYPISNINTGSTAGEITATIGGTVASNGAPTTAPQLIRRGQFSGLSISGFPSSGNFVVYRR